MFKKGSKYTRKDIGELYFPGVGRPPGGNWDTGYVRVGDDLIIFMNINVAGRTGHDFNNHYDETNQTIVWFGKPNTHSEQPIFINIFEGNLTPHFFARWDNTDPNFTYLGIGKVVTFEDGTPTTDGNGNPATTIKVVLTCQDAEEIISLGEGQETVEPSFALEKHLEDFIVKNWNSTDLGKDYDIYEEDGEVVGKQYQTETGPLDILAISKDKKEFLVIELKKGRASDQVIGQLKRYMGYIKSKLAVNDEIVKGCIIALKEDSNLKYALMASPDVEFYKYQVNFSLVKNDSNPQ
jgi:hypothetical protein